MELSAVERNYVRLAPGYDLGTELVFHRLLGLGRHRVAMIERLGELDGATVLDVGCGTGNNWPLLVPRIGPAGRIVGVDYSSGMLERGRRRARKAGWSNVSLTKDDAATLSTVNIEADATVSAWCLGIVHDLPAALDRLVDATRPGGRIAILGFARSHPERGVLRRLYPVYSRALIALGVDAAEDIDDAALQARWEAGREVLRARLPDLVEERFREGTGMLLHGTRPAADANRS